MSYLYALAGTEFLEADTTVVQSTYIGLYKRFRGVSWLVEEDNANIMFLIAQEINKVLKDTAITEHLENFSPGVGSAVWMAALDELLHPYLETI